MVNPTTTETTVQVSTVSSIPALHAFDAHTTTWQSYRDRISFYFKANRIIQDDDKKALFLWSVGDTTYNLLESLISPRSLTKEDTTFDEIIKLLNLHYDDTKNIMTSTYDFYSCIQKPGQSFLEWKAELCEKMRHCGFSTSCLKDKPQDRALRDMYVIGIRSLKVRQALLKEQDPDLETTERIIQVAERLAEDVRHFNGSNNNTEYTVSKLQRSQTKQQTQQQQHRSTSKIDSKQCESCGSNNHIRSECKYRSVSCNFCKRTGHLERVCRKKKEGKSVIKHLTTSFNNINQKESTTDSTRISLLVNDINIPFDLDTGAAHTVINMDVWHKLGSPVMHSSKIKLNCYNGTILKIIGQCNVNVEHNGRIFDLHIIVVDGNGISLLGLQWIKIMKLDLNTIIHGADIPSPIHKIHNELDLQMMLEKYKNILNNELGHCTKVLAHIELKPDSTPKLLKPRPLPFAYMNGIKEEIQRQVQAGILERVETSVWAAPIVPIKKPNGKIRICGDFKVTINPHMLVDQYPIPLIDELLARLNNGQQFTKLDLSDAYLQVELDEESKNLVVINTPLGLFKYNRMPFGISNAPAIFQKTIDQVIAGIPNCIAYLDDILITGANEQEHLQTLDKVLLKLSEFGFRCNPEKCSFFQNQVSYLGFIIDSHGKRPDPSRVTAIINMPAPRNVKEVEAFIGKVNYYGKFISNFSDKCTPLNRLRRANTPWLWSKECQNAFNNLVQEIANVTTLAHSDPQLPLILATDASSYGIGAVILHRYSDGSERPIAHASKTLTTAEKNYSQIEKEALSIIYGVKKFDQYLVGRKFELCTDHQPLLTIFNPVKGIPVSTANRLQRWAICLMGYTYTIRYKNTQSHGNADALSRLPVGPDDSFTDQDSSQINLIQEVFFEECLVNAEEITKATENDKILQLVKQFTLTKWPTSISKLTKPELIPYFNNRHSISIVKGCLLKDIQVIIPQQLHRQVLRMLHRAHIGTIKMKQLARSHCWWPHMDKDIMEVTKACQTCAQCQSMPKQEFKSWDEPTHNWSRVHMDFAGPIWGSKWLLLVDAKSKFPLVADMKNDTTANNLCQVLEQVIDWFGPPESLVSDNGPPFNSYEMKKFYNKYGITHITTAPYHPASNGLAERFVRSFKEGMNKEQQSGQTDKSKALRNVLRSYRWTPHASTGSSPAEMMLQHSIRTELHRLKPHESTVPQQTTKFTNGQLVWTSTRQTNKRSQWQPGIITAILGSMNYEIQLNDGQRCKRHQNQRRLRYSSTDQSSDVDSLPDDLLDNMLQSKSTQSSISTQPSKSTSPRYPRRIRRPPERFSPS